MRSGIYFILNKVSLKLYIGSAVYFARRRSEHFTRLSKNIHHNEHLQRAYNKYGPEAFDFIIVELVELDKLIERETYYITKHKAIEEEFGYNKCPFGVSAIGRKHSAETKAKMSASQKGRKRAIPPKVKINVAKTKEESNLKISITMKARFIGINTNANRAKMAKAANARWGNKHEYVTLASTQTPIVVTSKKDLII